MKRLLWQKMIRDMKKAFTTYILCVVVVAIGFCGYSILELCYENLDLSRQMFFDSSDFCDGFAENKEAPLSAASVLKRIRGVDEAQGRLVKDVSLYTAGDGEAELHLVSWSEGQMNRPVLSAGTLPEDGKREIIIGDGMAKARGYRIGDTIELIISGKRVGMTITGIGLTPENIYMIRNMSDLFPTPSSYDAAFTSYSTMAGLYGESGMADGFLIRLSPGTVWEDVERDIGMVMEPYGLISHYAREDQLAVSMVGEEIKQLSRMSGVVPFLFLMVATVILYITLSRLVEQQRTQVGTLMALGIPVKSIKFHYMSYGAVVGLLGGLSGGILGYLSAGPMAGFYRMYFNLPDVTAPLSMGYLFKGIFFAGIFCAGVSYKITGRLGKLKPAEALRPEAPKAARSSFLEKIPGFAKLFTVPGMMAVRSLARNRKRTAMSITGIAFAYMITATLVSMSSLFDDFIFDYWEKTQRQDMTVQFEQPVRAVDALEAVSHGEIQEAEGIVEFPMTLSGPSGQIDCSIQAIAEDSSLVRLYREDGSRAYTEREGIILSQHMAKVMGVGKGSVIEAKISYPKEKTSRVQVTDIIAQYMGSNAYMSYDGAAGVSDFRDCFTGVLVKAPMSVQQDMKDKLADASLVASVQSRKERVDQYRALMGSMSAIMASMSFMGACISFAVIYTSSLIHYEELKRELSTLMMLGLKSGQCLDVVSVSEWLLTAGAVILGIPMSMGMSRLISTAMASDLYTIPSFINIASLFQAVGLTALAVWFCSVRMHKKLKKIVPADLLRERE